jgi:soluble lytic murein transglycosylase-like protein
MKPTTRLALVIGGVLLLGCATGDAYDPARDPELIRANRLTEAPEELVSLPADGGERRVYPNIENFLDGENPALALYREPVTRDTVVEFFVARAGSESVALPILYYAERMDISLSLVFSLVWTESRFKITAVNFNSRSIDRGLFQLNSLTFRHLEEQDFFNPDVNTLYGLQYLEFCLEHGDDVAQALAIYNAGLRRVKAGQTPASTLIYVDRLLAQRARLEDEFRAFILSHFPPTIA